MDPASRFALQGHVAHPGQTHLRHSMRAAIWFLLPSDGTFSRSSTLLQYILTCQVRSVVLRGGDVTPTPWERYLNWVYDTTPPPSRDQGKKDLPPPLPRRSRQTGPPSPPRDHGKKNLPPQKDPQAPQEDKAPQETGKASFSLFQSHWKPAWNQPVAPGQR